MKIYLDFEGTVVEHQYPAIGAYNEGAFEVIAALQKAGHEIILNIYRVEFSRESLMEALAFLNNSGKIEKIKKYTPVKLEPKPWDLEQAKKDQVLFIDDIAPGIPLINALESNTMMVDWMELAKSFS